MIPRRTRLDMMTPPEHTLRNAIQIIEDLGAHPLLTDAVVLIGQAKDKVSDWVDKENRI